MVRSLLFVPAKEKFLNKISSLNSDGFIIDLEDSIKGEDKETALKVLCDFLNRNDVTSGLYVRINKDRFQNEVTTLNQYGVGFMLPKFEKIEDYQNSTDIWEKHEIIALIETPLGLVNASSIAACPWIDGLAFGAEDFTASINMENRSDLLLSYKSMLVLQAKACSKKIFDTPSFNILNQTDFEKDVEQSVSLGFDGKMLIHPSHIEYINTLFGKIDLDYLEYVISEYEKSGEAVVIVDGKVYEKMHINRMKKILRENK